MNNMMMSCFVETVRSGSITKAAENLFYAKQTVSRQIKKIESELGLQLFDRSNTKTGLTPAGQYYFDLFQTILYKYNTTMAAIDQYYKELNSAVRIGCSDRINPYGEIIHTLEMFKQDYKDIRISLNLLQNTALVKNLSDSKLDIAFIKERHYNESQNREMEIIPLCKQEMFVVGPDSVVGVDLPLDMREKRRDMDFLIVPIWEYRYMQAKVNYAQRLQILDIPIRSVRLVPNFASLYAAMEQMKYLSFEGNRFGFLNDIKGLGKESLKIDEEIICLIPLRNENRSVIQLVNYMRESMKAC